MSQRVTVETCFALVLTLLSTINAHSLPEDRKELNYKSADTEQSSLDNHSRITKDNVEGSQNKWVIPLMTSNSRGSSQLQRPGVPSISSTFQTRTEVLPLKDRNIIRYHLSETSVPLSQSPRTRAYVKQDKANTLSYSPPIPVDSRLGHRGNKIVKLNKEVINSPSTPQTFSIFQDYKPPNFVHSPSERFSTDGQHEDPPYLYGLSYLFAPEAQGLLNDDTEPHGGYQSDSTDSRRPFPRFSIPLHSLFPDSERSKDYNTENSVIIEPTFIVPKNIHRQLIPQMVSPTMTYGVSITDGKFSRKEIRKDNGEFFSSYRDYDVSSADVGSLVAKSDGDQVLVLKGSYSFTSPEGLRFRTDYTADETGYHATQVPVREDVVSAD